MTPKGATYLTEYGPDAQAAVLKLSQADSAESDSSVERWREISQLAHKHLIRLLDTGSCDFAGIRVAFVVSEWAEDNLHSVLAERPLTGAETRELLHPVLEVLAFLHGKGYLHGAIKPSNIMAIGDQLKLSSDNITRIGAVNTRYESTGCDAPELKKGIVCAAGDVWSLGVTLVQALTQRFPDICEEGRLHGNSNLVVSLKLPEPFSDIVRNCVRVNPESRWTVSQIAESIGGSLPDVSEPRTQSNLYRRRHQQSWPQLFTSLGVALVIIVFVLTTIVRLNRNKVSVAPAAVVTSVPKALGAGTAEGTKKDARDVIAPPETQMKSSSNGPTVAGKPSASAQSWYVVVATYNRRGDAEKRAKQIAHRWPQFETRVYSKPLETQLHLVIIGANLSEKDALILQNRARTAGLPRDTYIHRFSR